MKPALSSLTNLSRLAPQSHFLSLAKAETSTPDYEGLSAYSPTNLLAWIQHVGKYWFGAKHPFSEYHAPDTGIFRMGNQGQVSVVGDWGSGTNEAAKVGAQIRTVTPEFTIHLGDVYYTGNVAEVRSNFLGIKTSAFDPVTWPRGTKGTFTLLGNHEMFTHAMAYFDVLLPALGQKASYFCVENDFWRIVGIDTAYNSTGLDFWPFKPSCRLPDPLMIWLGHLHLSGDSRGLIVLSHHQPWSAFDTWYPTPAKQLAQFINRPILWFWGHEHRLAIYDRYSLSGGVTANGACIGHGGMPVELRKPGLLHGVTCLYTDARKYPNTEGLEVGYNGYANLIFDGENLRVEFRDLNGWLAYGENWTPKTL
jgi:hypothetical protein